MKHSAFEMGLSSAETIARRMPVMWWGMVKPTSASRAETVKMVVEKQMAFAETCVAIQAEMLRMMLACWKPVSADSMMQAVLAPSSRRVKANVKLCGAGPSPIRSLTMQRAVSPGLSSVAAGPSGQCGDLP